MPQMDQQMQNAFALRPPPPEFQNPSSWSSVSPSSLGNTVIAQAPIPEHQARQQHEVLQQQFTTQHELAQMLNGNGPMALRDGHTVTLIVGGEAPSGDSRASSSHSDSSRSDN